jgi:putative CocE/NonD family hydrolase
MAARFHRIPFGPIDPQAEQVMVPMRDGVRLATDVYLPHRPAGRLPVVLVRLPYDKSGEFSFMPQVAPRFTERGYAFVVQDVRGKVRSEGETFAFVHEVADGFDTLEWIARAPWSNGAVGMFGDSYYGFTQWAAAASGHPALRAMVPRMTTSEIGTDWMYLDGVFNLGTMLEWAAETWVEPALLHHDLDWAARPIDAVVPATLAGQRSASLDHWRRRGPDDPFWTSGIFPGGLPVPGRIPTLHVGGWYDVFSRGQLRDYARASASSGAADQFLVMDASDHFDDVLTAAGRTDDYAASQATLAVFLDSSYLPPALAFFDRYLRGGDSLAAPPVRWALGEHGLRESSTWPPAGAAPLVLFPTAAEAALGSPDGGGLASSPDGVAGQVSWTHDPADPVPSLVPDPWRPLLALPDESSGHGRDDVATFTGDALRLPLDLAGPAVVEVELEANHGTAHLVATLCDVAPDGAARRILEGAALVVGAEPGVGVRVDLGDTGYRLAGGHRLRLALAGSSYPRWVVHPGTDEDPFDATATHPVELRVRLGSSTRLVLTSLPR